jgi:hypothetical protein
MTLWELDDLTDWIDVEIKSAEIPKRYQNLVAVLQKNTQTPQKEPFENQKVALFDVLSNVDLFVLNQEQTDAVDRLGILANVGHAAIDEINDVLYKNAIDVATAHKKVNEMLGAINQGIAKSDQIKGALSGLIDDRDYQERGATLKVRFTNGVALNNLSDLKTWSSNWYEIGRGIAMANGQTPDEIEIVGAAEGSILLFLGATYAVVKTIGDTVLKALSVAERVLEIRKKAEEVKALQLGNDKLYLELLREADKLRDSKKESIATEVLASIGGKPDGETRTAIERSITKLLEFVENGGEIDCYLPPTESTRDDDGTDPSEAKHRALIDKVKTDFESIREIEDRLRLLSDDHGTDDPKAHDPESKT